MIRDIEHKNMVCPLCKTNLALKGEALSCSRCGKDWPVKEGIADFRILRDRYWGEYPQDLMDRFISRCADIGWKEALAEFFRERDPEYYKYILDDKRADWKFLVPIDEEARILDAGCGWGTLSFALAKDYKHVTAFDIVRPRINFIDLRRRAEKALNILPVCGQINMMPFPDEFFDLVVLNGVLEWIPVIEREKDPCLAQTEALREARRVLKKGGYLYLASENRWAAINFLGFKDSHSGLRFVSILPRFLANIYSRLVRGKDFREYTYTYGELRRILKNSGFIDAEFYAPLPAYRKFYYFVPLKDRRHMDFFLKYLVIPRTDLQEIFVNLAMPAYVRSFIKYFVPDFSILAKK